MGRLRFLRQLLERQTLAAEAVGIVLRLSGSDRALTGRELEVLNSEGDLWRYFWSAEAVSILNQGVRAHGYGRRRNPGHADIQQAAYLAFADMFATNDFRFTHRVLRVVERVGRHRKQIWNFATLVENL